MKKSFAAFLLTAVISNAWSATIFDNSSGVDLANTGSVGDAMIATQISVSTEEVISKVTVALGRTTAGSSAAPQMTVCKNSGNEPDLTQCATFSGTASFDDAFEYKFVEYSGTLPLDGSDAFWVVFQDFSDFAWAVDFSSSALRLLSSPTTATPSWGEIGYTPIIKVESKEPSAAAQSPAPTPVPALSGVGLLLLSGVVAGSIGLMRRRKSI